MDDDKLRGVLREWEAPEPNPQMDARVRNAWRAAHPPAWKWIWTARVSVPVPVLAALLVLAAFLSMKFGVSRSTPWSMPQAHTDTMSNVTRLNAGGFQPVPNGDARIVTVKEAQ